MEIQNRKNALLRTYARNLSLKQQLSSPVHLRNLSFFLGESLGHSSQMSLFLKNHRDSKFLVYNPEQSLLALYKALVFIRTHKGSKERPLRVLFVNTNPEFAKINRSIAVHCQQYYINTKWVGGTLTNWKQVVRSIKAFRRFQRKWQGLSLSKNLYGKESARNLEAEIMFPRLEKFHKWFSGYDLTSVKRRHTLSSLTQLYQQNKSRNFGLLKQSGSSFHQDSFFADFLKTIQWSFRSDASLLQERRNLQNLLPLIGNSLYSEFAQANSRQGSKKDSKDLPKTEIGKPDLLVILDPYHQQNALAEAKLENIPVIAFVNSETNLENVTFPIPGNIQNHFFLHFCLNWICRALKGPKDEIKTI